MLKATALLAVSALSLGVALLFAAPTFAEEGEGGGDHVCKGVEDGALHRPEQEAPYAEATGGVIVRAGTDCESLEVVVRGIANDVALDVTLHGGDKVIEMGSVPAGEEGQRRLKRYGCEDDTLPGDVERVSKLFEYEIVVKDSEGHTALFGRVPVVRCEKDAPPKEEPPKEDPGEGAEVEQATAALTLPASPPDADATGQVTVWRKGESEEFSIELGNLDPGSLALLYIANAEGVYLFVKDIRIGEEGAAGYEQSNGPERTLPLGVASLSELANRGIEVRNTNNDVLLSGLIPELAPPPVLPVLSARASLTRTAETPFAEARGSVGVWQRGSRERLDIEVSGFGPEVGLLFYLENAEGGLVIIEDPGTNGDGRATLKFETGFDRHLPLEAETLADLAGRRIEVHVREGAAVLTGVVPAVPESNEAVRELASHEDEETGTDVNVQVRIDPEKGRETLTLKLRDLPRDAAPTKRRRARGTVTLLLDDGTGTLVLVTEAKIKRKRRARLRWNSKKGDTLPLGASTLRELSGRAFEVWVGSTRAADGFFPFF